MKSRLLSLLAGLLFIMIGSLGTSACGLAHKESQAAPAHSEITLGQAQKPDPQKVDIVSEQPTYRFIAFGDWGSGMSGQKRLAAQMAAQYAKEPFADALLLGDNIYEVGDVAKYGKAYFTDMYAPLLKGGVQFLVSLGNHDYAGGHQAEQIRFFKMPGYYYMREIQIRGASIALFAIDTNTFANNEVQQKWLNKALGESTATWKVVFGHHPIYSSGLHGDNAGLSRTLEPLLVKHKVDIYLAGHDHDYERFQPINGVQHIVSGGGGASLRGFLKASPMSLVRKKAQHFLSFTLAGSDMLDSTLTMQVIDDAGSVIDTARWEKPARKEEQPALKPAS